MKTIILGGGLAAFSLADSLEESSVIIEKEELAGGLCRSFDFHGIKHDIGPHILFSKDKEALGFLSSLAETNELRRSNRIFHEGIFVKYPFENELSALPPEERDYCVKEFLNNPYGNYPAGSMLQFFLKTFGEGITRLYLQPYNEKIWKFDPAFMDTQMVERIPKPPKEDVLKSARGEATEGYTHQLFFRYPKEGGIQSLINGLESRVKGKAEILAGAAIERISGGAGSWEVKTGRGAVSGERLINCMPLHELFRYIEAPSDVVMALDSLKYNSIHIVMIKTRRDRLGNNFAVNFARRDTIFHRLSKLDFLGKRYGAAGASALMAEITFRPGSYIGEMKKEEVVGKVLDDLDSLGLAKKEDILDADLKQFKYAYVIYDLDHRKNADIVLGHLRKNGIRCSGRFAEFEYLNMDAVVRHSMTLAAELNSTGKKKLL